MSESEPSHPILAATLDVAMFGLREVRDRVVPEATGAVLELGVGTGLNLGRYDAGRVSRVVGIEPDPHMRKRAQKRAEGAPVEVELWGAGAEALPFSDAEFDTVVATFVLCTIPEVQAALEEARRVLKPSGRLLFAEHVRSAHRPEARVQDALTPLWRACAGGCHLNRDAVALIERAGFSDVQARPRGRQRLKLLPVVSGSARP